MKRLLTFFLIGIFLIFLIVPMVNAGFFDFLNSKQSIGVSGDNIQIGEKEFSKSEVVDKYKIININSWLGLGTNKFAGAIKEHTQSCGSNCKSNLEIYLSSQDVLIEDIRFIGDQPDDYGIYIQNGTKQVLVDDYNTVCENVTKEFSRINNKTKVNETYYKEVEECSKNKIGSHYETEPTWREYTIGEELPAGNYNVDIRGSKGLFEKTDWQIKTQGKWLEEWALWDDDTKAYYKLDETTGDVVDATGNGYNGTNNGGTRGVAGKINNAFYFEESDDYSESSFDVSYQTEYSWSLWIKPNSYPLDGSENAIMFRKEASAFSNRHMHYCPDNEIGMSTGNGTAKDGLVYSGDDSILPNNWYHVVYTAKEYDEAVLYLNGEKVDNTTMGVFSSGVGNILGIGAKVTDPSYGFNGTIDEIGIWDRALSSSEVSDLYNNGTGISYGGYGGTKVYLKSPSNAEKINNTSEIEFNVFANATQISVGTNLVNMSLYTNESGNWEQRNVATGLSGTYNNQIWHRTLDDGDYKWNVEACVSDGTCVFNSVNYTFSLDASPPSINIEAPSGTLDYGAIGETETLNVTITDTHLDSCWYNYNGTNQKFSCSSGVKATESFELGDYGINHNLTVYANDTYGGNTNNFIEWDYKTFGITESYNPTTVEGNIETFSINLSINEAYQISIANLVYNGTSYSSTFSKDGTEYYISKDFPIPEVVSEENKTFYWSINLDDSTQINTTTKTQTVNPLELDDCSTYPELMFNLTLKDEQTTNTINATDKNSEIEVEMILINPLGQEFSAFEKVYNSTNPAQICGSSGIINSSFDVDITISYEADDYVTEFYHIQDLSIDEVNFPQNIDLFDLLITSSQEFLISFKDENFLPLKDALINIQRKYIGEGTYRSVEIPKTDSDGQTLGHLELGDTIYRFSVYKDGELIATFSDQRAVCENLASGDCKINLNTFSTSQDPFDWTEYGNILYEIEFDESNRKVDLEFETTDGTVKTGLLELIQLDNFQNETICSDSLTSSAGSLTCNIPESYGNTTSIANFYLDGEFVTSKMVTIKPSAEEIFGPTRIIMILVLFLTIPFIFITSGIGVIISVIIGFIIMFILGLMEGGSLIGTGSILMWIVISGGIIIWKISTR